MNELLTHEGGQPLFLDDLRLIQDNGASMLRLLLKGLTGKDGGYLLEPYSPEVETENGVTTYRMSGNAVVHEGRILPFDGGSWTSADGGMYVCVKITPADYRTFADGQQRACQERREAYLSSDVTGADWFGDVTELRSLPELMSRQTGQESETFDWIEIPAALVTFKNGYDGTLKYSREAPLRMKIDVRTSQKQWSSEVADRGVIATITDAQLRQSLGGMTTANFTYNPLRPDGTLLWEGGAIIDVLSNGNVMIYHMGENGLVWGVPGLDNIPDASPCGAEDEYASVSATLYK